MKRVAVKLFVPADIGVTSKMVQDLLSNQLHFLLSETSGGQIRWKDATILVNELPR